MVLYKNSTTGLTGVTWDYKKDCFKAQLSRNGRCFFLGYFVDKEKAYEARLEFIEKLNQKILLDKANQNGVETDK